MEENGYEEFQKFSTREQAADVADMLSRNHITSVLDELPGLAYVLSSNAVKEYHVKLQPRDFDKANALLLKQSTERFEEVDMRRYLHSFTDAELMEIVQKPDEWSRVDFMCAQRLLKNRGKEVSEAQLAKLQKERLAYLAQPETVSIPWIVLLYAFALLGGPIAVFSGWHLMRHQKILPNGKKVRSYSSTTRAHGLAMLIIGILAIVAWVSFWMVTKL